MSPIRKLLSVIAIVAVIGVCASVVERRNYLADCEKVVAQFNEKSGSVTPLKREVIQDGLFSVTERYSLTLSKNAMPQGASDLVVLHTVRFYPLYLNGHFSLDRERGFLARVPSTLTLKLPPDVGSWGHSPVLNTTNIAYNVPAFSLSGQGVEASGGAITIQAFIRGKENHGAGSLNWDGMKVVDSGGVDMGVGAVAMEGSFKNIDADVPTGEFRMKIDRVRAKVKEAVLTLNAMEIVSKQMSDDAFVGGGVSFGMGASALDVGGEPFALDGAQVELTFNHIDSKAFKMMNEAASKPDIERHGVMRDALQMMAKQGFSFGMPKFTLTYQGQPSNWTLDFSLDPVPETAEISTQSLIPYAKAKSSIRISRTIEESNPLFGMMVARGINEGMLVRNAENEALMDAHIENGQVIMNGVVIR